MYDVCVLCHRYIISFAGHIDITKHFIVIVEAFGGEGDFGAVDLQ